MYTIDHTLYIENVPIGTSKPLSNSKLLLYKVDISDRSYSLLKKHLAVFENKDDVEKALKLYETFKERIQLVEITFPIKTVNIDSLLSYLNENVKGITMKIDKNNVLLANRDGAVEQKYGVIKLWGIDPEKFFNKIIQEKFNRLSELLGVKITELSFKDEKIVDIDFRSPVVLTKDKIKAIKEVKDWFNDEIKVYLEKMSDQFEILCRYYTSLFSFISDLKSMKEFTKPVNYVIVDKFNTVYISTKITRAELEYLKSLNLKKYRLYFLTQKPQKPVPSS